MRRFALARGLMDEHGLSALVVFGNSGVEPREHGEPVLALEPPRPAPLLPRRPARPRAGARRSTPGSRTTSRTRARSATCPIIEWGGVRPGRARRRAPARARRSRAARSASSASTRPSRWACPTRTTRACARSCPASSSTDVTLAVRAPAADQVRARRSSGSGRPPSSPTRRSSRSPRARGPG